MFRLPKLSKQKFLWGLILFLFISASYFVCLELAASSQAAPAAAKQTNTAALSQADDAVPEETDLEPEEQGRDLFEKAVVLEVQNSSQRTTTFGSFTEQIIKARVLSGPYKGEEIELINSLTGSKGIDIDVKPGDKVILCLTVGSGADGNEFIQSANLSDRLRSPALVWLAILFAGLILFIGRLQGLKSLLGLGVTVLGIYMILLPGLIAGKNALPLTIMVLIAVTLITMIFVAGFSRKSIAATLGTLGGLIVAGLLAYFFGDMAHLSGVGTEEERMLLLIDNIEINTKGILFSGILIGALGAIMDVAMSVASTVSEVKKANPELRALQLMGAGMNVGRDIMGTMTNTLILAYTGSALPLMILFMVYKMEPICILNWEMIATEIVRALVGSIALITCIPITALVAGWLNADINHREVDHSI